jgi:hypothetical protein
MCLVVFPVCYCVYFALLFSENKLPQQCNIKPDVALVLMQGMVGLYRLYDKWRFFYLLALFRLKAFFYLKALSCLKALF